MIAHRNTGCSQLKLRNTEGSNQEGLNQGRIKGRSVKARLLKD